MGRTPDVGTGLRRLRLSLDLLVGRRAAMVLGADLVLLFAGIVTVADGEADSRAVFANLVVVPYLLLGVPVLADALALERRAGCLDLALSSPGAAFYFERRIGSFLALLAVQGSLVMVLDWIFSERPYPLLFVLAQGLVLAALVGAGALYWGTRLRNNATVIFAQYATVALLSPWLLDNPVPPGYEASGSLVYPGLGILGWARTNLVLVVAATILYLYARRRLGRPERLL